jgi:hypothetical protein
MPWNIQCEFYPDDYGGHIVFNGMQWEPRTAGMVATITAERDALLVAKYPGCKVLSLGDSCPCKICTLERERDALREKVEECDREPEWFSAMEKQIADLEGENETLTAERDALEARVRELEQHIALIENGLANAH